MQEILPGLWHWRAFHDGIGANVDCHFVEPAGVLIDPMVPPDGTDAFAGRARPQQIVLTSGLHTRGSAELAEAFGCPIRVSRAGAARIGDALDVEPYDWGEELAPGVTALEIGVLCPDEGALHVDVGDGAISFADGITHYGDALGFVPDDLLGEDAAGIKEGLKRRYEGLLTRTFDNLLFAHGRPLVGGGKAALKGFVTSPAGNEDFGQTI